MGLLAGAGAALTVLSAPVGIIELIVASTGLSEMVPAAGPPLGLKARLLIAGFAALMAIGLVWTMSRQAAGAPRQIGNMVGRGRDDRQGASKMGFALSKLTALARGRITSPRAGRAPVLRRADAHPDAPSRQPIFASRDFSGLDIFARTEPGHREIVVAAEPERDPIVGDTGLLMPSAPLPLAAEDLPSPTIARTFRVSPVEEPAPETSTSELAPIGPDHAAEAVEAEDLPPASASSLDHLSIADLTDRLERGLALRMDNAVPGTGARAPASVIAQMPIAQAVPVREEVAPDVDDALRAALGTLRTMAARAR